MTMQIRIFNKIHNQKLDDYLRRRLELVVGRFEKRIAHIEVHLLDENDIKGGEDKVCTIEVKLIPRGQLHVRAKHEDIYAAAVKAVHRVETVVAKAVDRSHRSSEVRHRAGSVRNAARQTVQWDQMAE